MIRELSTDPKTTDVRCCSPARDDPKQIRRIRANPDAAQSLVPPLALLFGLWRPAGSPGQCSDSRLRRLMDLIEPAARDKTISPAAAFLAIRVLDGSLGCGCYAPAMIDRVTAVGASLAGCLPAAEARTLLGDLLNAAERARATGSPDGT